MKTICVCTSVHKAWDVRIYEKEIKTLLKKHKVIYVAPNSDSPLQDLHPNLTYLPLKTTRNRIFRIMKIFFVFIKLYSLRKQVESYHVHDPELSIVLAVLKILTRKYCIFDIHENHAAAIRDRFWIPKQLRKIFSISYLFIEKITLPFFDTLICTTDEISEMYPQFKNKILLKNYPKQIHYKTFIPTEAKKPHILLSGGLTTVRGIIPTVKAFANANLPKDYILILLGWFESEKLKENVFKILSSSDKKNQYQHISWVPYIESVKYIHESAIGIVPYLDYENHRFGFPNKIYEFMASNTPFIYNKLPNYLNTIQALAGIAVDCSNSTEISNALKYLANNHQYRQKISKQGRQIFLKKFNWEEQEHILFKLYEF